MQCEVFDRDVLRVPPMAQMYRTRGNTALAAATLQAIEELEQTSQLHGDHAFLVIVKSDGEDNRSTRTQIERLRQKLDTLPDNWTVACLVPDQFAKHEAMKFGFPADNIAIWDARDDAGLEEAARVEERATENFMTGRARGVRGTRSVFSTGVDAVNADTVKANLAPLPATAYDIIPVHNEDYIRPFVESRGLHYKIGSGYYQLTKRETIQHRKAIAIREKATGCVYAGAAARDLLGLGGDDVRVTPETNPAWDVFVQSTSVNRRLVAGTDLLVLR